MTDATTTVRAGQDGSQAVYAAAVVAAALALLLAVVSWVVSLVLDGRRLACREDDWPVTEPQWAGRR